MKPSAAVALRLAILGGVCVLPLSVRAYSDPASFGNAPLAAGGGGRYFTGSPADGYTCKACHEGGAEPQVSVLGLPVAGYQPGKSYEVSLTWQSEAAKLGAALELTDTQGRPAGTLRLPTTDEAQSAEFCEPASDQVLAATISEASNQRQVVQLPDCGARRLRVLWTAPSTDSGPVWFSGSAVWSDGEGDPYHDGVTDFGRILGSPAVASVATQSCSVHGVHRERGLRKTFLWAWGLCASGVFARHTMRRRAERRRS